MSDVQTNGAETGEALPPQVRVRLLLAGVVRRQLGNDWEIMSKTALKVGDWAMLGEDVVQVKEVRKDGSYDVSTGIIRTSGSLGDRLYPFTLENKVTADCTESYCREMREMCRGVNWPDLASWIEYQLAAAAGNAKAQEAFLERLRIVRDQLREISRLEFDGLGINVFRR